jgi:hypothetical protein
MKYVVATFVFFLTLGLTVKTIANETATTCTPETSAACAPAHKAGHSEEDIAAKMNSLFPTKQKDPKKTNRPSVVELSAPKFLSAVAAGTTNLEWKPADGANAYHIQVATDPNFKWLVAEDHFVKTNSFSFTKAEAGQRYFWRVAAFNTDNDSMFTKSNFVSSAFNVK